MEKKMNNEELQSRREFFKKAAKATLPMIAAVALASAPAIVNAESIAPSSCAGCNNRCMNFCTTTCHGTCKSHCADTCNSSCRTSCSSTCGRSSKY